MCELRIEPAGVATAMPLLHWAYTSSQTPVLGFIVVVTEAPDSTTPTVVWNSGHLSASATSVVYGGSALKPATVYGWSVSFAGSSSRSSESSTSSTSRFSTSPTNWSPTTIWLQGSNYRNQDQQQQQQQQLSKQPTASFDNIKGTPIPIRHPTFAYFKRRIKLNAGTTVVSGLLFVGAAETHKLLGSYIFSVNGNTVGIGPGRSLNQCELGKNVFGNKCTPSTTAFDSYDLSSLLNGKGTSTSSSMSGGSRSPAPAAENEIVLAAQMFAAESEGQLAAELHLSFSNGSSAVIGADSQWKAYNATAIFGPVGTAGTQYYVQPHAFMDARRFLGSSGSIDEWKGITFDESSWEPAACFTAENKQ